MGESYDGQLHLKVVKFYATVVGIWIYKSIGPIIWLYYVYALTIFAFFFSMHLSQFYRAIMIFGKNWEEFMVNQSIYILYFMGLIKAYFFRSDKFQALILKIQKLELNILNGKHKEIKEIYKNYAFVARRSGVICLIIGWISLTTYFFVPKVRQDITKTNYDDNNLFVNESKYLPFSTWFPFDTNNKYYELAYTLQVLYGCVGGSYVMSADIIFFSSFIFCNGQLKILQHYFANLHTYAMQLQKDEHIPYDKAEVKFTKICIRKYNEIIEFVTTLDSMLQTFMLFNFLQTSFKLSMLILQMLQPQQKLFSLSTLSLLTFFMYLCSEVYFYYFNANDILVESTECLHWAIASSEWYNYSEEVKKDLMMTMMRSNIPCEMKIGPFYVMNLQAVINITRAVYYYVCIIYKN